MRLVSVALFLAFTAARADGLWRLGVTQHPALRSPDFPLPAAQIAQPAATAWLTSNEYFSTLESASLDYEAIRQRIVAPALSGTTVCSPNTYSPGTVHDSRSSVTVSPLRGRP
jgi:hypothetical protein